MLTSTVLVTLCKTKVDNEDLVAVGFCGADEEVIRLNITMDDSLGVNLLEVMHQLNCD